MRYIIKNIKDYNFYELSSFYKIIPKYKADKIKCLVKENSRISSIIGEILLKDLLDYHNLCYNDLVYYTNFYGKPYIKNCKFFYNISHSFDYVITIISKKEIGVDIEKIRKTSLNSINYFATKSEKMYILSSDCDVYERIFKIYTLKEAYFKMIGSNLDNILSVEFVIDGNDVFCSDNTVNAGFISDINEYIIAYCERKF